MASPLKSNSQLYPLYLKLKGKRIGRILMVLASASVLLSAALWLMARDSNPMVAQYAELNLVCVPGFLFVYLLDIITYRNPVVLPLPLKLKDWAALGEIALITTFAYTALGLVLALLGVDLTAILVHTFRPASRDLPIQF